MSYAPGAPERVWSIPGDVLDAGAKLTAMVCWSKADHEIQRDPRPCTVYFPRRAFPAGHPKAGRPMGLALARDTCVAERTGATVDAVRKHWTKLRRLGIADANGRCVDLHTPAHIFDHGPSGEDHSHTGEDHSPRTTVAAARTTVAAARTTVAAARTTVAVQLTPPVPPSPPRPGEGCAHDIAAELSPELAERLRRHKILAANRAEVERARLARADQFGPETRAAIEAAHLRMAPLTPEHRLAVVAAGFERDLGSSNRPGGRDTWAESLADAIHDHAELTPEATGRVLEAWAAAPQPKPERRGVWWPRSWAWVAGVLGVHVPARGKVRPNTNAPEPGSYGWDADDLREELARPTC